MESSSSLAFTTHPSFFFSFTCRFHHSSSSLPPHGSLSQKEADWLWHPIKKTDIVTRTQVFYKFIYLFIIIFFRYGCFAVLLSLCDGRFALICMTVAPPRSRTGLRFVRANGRISGVCTREKQKQKQKTKQNTHICRASIDTHKHK